MPREAPAGTVGRGGAVGGAGPWAGPGTGGWGAAVSRAGLAGARALAEWGVGGLGAGGKDAGLGVGSKQQCRRVGWVHPEEFGKMV